MTARQVSTNSLWLPPDHPTSTIFLDETGLLRRDRYFGIGVLKLADASTLMRQIQRLRDRYDFRDELHWAGFDKAAARARPRSVAFAKAVIDLFFRANEAHFCCHIADRQSGDITAQFKGHRHAGELAYESLASAVLREVIGESEVVSVLADRRSTSPSVAFEQGVLRSVNDVRQRLAIASVCRIDSRSTDALQAVDLLLGAAAFDLRRGETDKESQKQVLLAHLLEHCACVSFRPGGREDPAGRWKVKLLARPSKTRRKARGG
jgi:hypothetical protein